MPAAVRHALVAALMLLVAACADAPAPVVAPPPAPKPPAVSMSPRLLEAASAYRGYLMRVQAISPAFADGGEVAQALRTGARYEPGQLVRGAIVYGAIAALQDRAFVSGLQAYGRDPAQRRQMAFELIRDPAYARNLPGAAGATALAVAAMGGEGQRLYDQGKAVKQAAYDIQKSPWSRESVASRPERLAEAKAHANAMMLGDSAETQRLGEAARGLTPIVLTPAEARFTTPSVTRALAIAALAALGEAGEANVDAVLGLTLEPNVAGCMTSARLNLYQCLAVAGPHYEDVFCNGQHALMDTGRCLIRQAGLAEPVEARFVPDASSIARKMPPPKAPARRPARKR
jgi:hypothetical protein